MGGLREEATRQTRAGPALHGALDPPRCHRQQPPRRHRQRGRLVQVEGLSLESTTRQHCAFELRSLEVSDAEPSNAPTPIGRVAEAGNINLEGYREQKLDLDLGHGLHRFTARAPIYLRVAMGHERAN